MLPIIQTTLFDIVLSWRLSRSLGRETSTHPHVHSLMMSDGCQGDPQSLGVGENTALPIAYTADSHTLDTYSWLASSFPRVINI